MKNSEARETDDPQTDQPESGSGEDVAKTEVVPCRLSEFLAYFLRLGTFGFGGPIALAGYMQRDLVEQRRWISKQDYVEGLALAQLAPGPLAAQLAMYLGWVRGGVAHQAISLNRGESMKRLPSWRVFAVLATVALLTGCGANNSDAVVIYTSVDDVFARPIVERFQKETGIQANLVTDTEETKGTGLVNRLIAEKARPQADVFWSGDPVRAAMLKAKGVTAAYHSPQAEGLPKLYSDPEGHWTGLSARARVIIYNKNLVPAGEEPKSVMDLLEPRFKGKACIANPLFGTTSMHAAALFQVLGDDKAQKFLDDFAANGGKILSSNGEVRRRVANGEFALGLTDTDDYNEARKEGKPVAVAYPDAEGMGTLIVPNAVVLVAGGPRPELGKKFIDWLLRPETEKLLAESDAAQMPVRSGVPVPPYVTPVDKLKPMQVDYAKLADRLDVLAGGVLKQWVDRNGR